MRPGRTALAVAVAEVLLAAPDGVLVHKDVDHLTQLFARTLGPYLLRGLDAVTQAGPGGADRAR